MKIELLPRDVQSYIRTGVAITSVGQCIEELVLNSLDAGATCIAVRIDLDSFKVQVVDNGSGISRDELELLGNRFCTSKCHSLEDLENLTHHGYRGEALASIRDCCGVLKITTREKHSSLTYCKIFREGKAMNVVESSESRPSSGTTATVHELFINFPVRQKSLNKTHELERTREILESIALIRPSVSFSLRNDITGQVVFQTRKGTDTGAIVSQLYGPAKSGMLLPVEACTGIYQIAGFFGREGHSRKNLQFVYVNGRIVKKTRIHKILSQALLNLPTLRPKVKLPADSPEMSNQNQYVFKSPPKFSEVHPVFIVQVQCPVSEYDITFEPAKTMVEFKDWDTLVSCVEDLVTTFVGNQNGFLKESKQIQEQASNKGDKEANDARTFPNIICPENMKDALKSKTAKRKARFPDNQFKTPQNPDTKIPINKAAIGLGKKAKRLVVGRNDSFDSSMEHDENSDASQISTDSEISESIDAKSSLLKGKEEGYDFVAGESKAELDIMQVHKGLITGMKSNTERLRVTDNNSSRTASDSYGAKTLEESITYPASSLSWYKKSIGKVPLPTRSVSVDESLKKLERIAALQSTSDRLSCLQKFRKNSHYNFALQQDESKAGWIQNELAQGCSNIFTGARNNNATLATIIADQSKEVKKLMAIQAKPKVFKGDLQIPDVLMVDQANTDVLIQDQVNPNVLMAEQAKPAMQAHQQCIFNEIKANEIFTGCSKTDELGSNIFRSHLNAFHYSSKHDQDADYASGDDFHVCGNLEKRNSKHCNQPSTPQYVAYKIDLENMMDYHMNGSEVRNSEVKCNIFDWPYVDLAGQASNGSEQEMKMNRKRLAINNEMCSSSKVIKLHEQDFGEVLNNAKSEVDLLNGGDIPVGEIKWDTVSADNDDTDRITYADDIIQATVCETRIMNDGLAKEMDINATSFRNGHEGKSSKGSTPAQTNEYCTQAFTPSPYEVDCLHTGCSGEFDSFRIKEQENMTPQSTGFSPSLNLDEFGLSPCVDIEMKHKSPLCCSIGFIPSKRGVESDEKYSKGQNFHENAVEDTLLDDTLLETSEQSNCEDTCKPEVGTTVLEKNKDSYVHSERFFENLSCESVSLTQLMENVENFKTTNGNNSQQNSSESQSEPAKNMYDASNKNVFTFADLFDDTQSSVSYITNTKQVFETTSDMVSQVEVLTGTSVAFSEAEWEREIAEIDTGVAMQEKNAEKQDYNSNTKFQFQSGSVNTKKNKNKNNNNDNEERTLSVDSCSATKNCLKSCSDCHTHGNMKDKNENADASHMRSTNERWDARKWTYTESEAAESLLANLECLVKSSVHVPVPDFAYLTRPGEAVGITYQFSKQSFNNVKVLGQLDNKFIVCLLKPPLDDAGSSKDSADNEMLLLVDQHAAHERIRLEILTEEAFINGEKGGPLVPYEVAPPRQLTFIENEIRNLTAFTLEYQKLGITFDPDSSTTILVRSVPNCLVQKTENADKIYWDTIKVLMLEHIGVFMSTRGAQSIVPQTVHKVLCQQACHGAIKFGDSLSREECERLIRDLSLCDMPFQCAHGRPSITPLMQLSSLGPFSVKPRRKPRLDKLRMAKS